jgi:MFS family permease
MRKLGLLWIGQFISQVGDGFFTVTLPFLVLLISHESASLHTGIVMLLNFLPFLVIGPFAGALVDRLPRIRLMILSDLARGLIIVMIPLAFMFDFLSWPLVGTVAFLMATASTVFNPARDALIPELAEGRSLARANAFFQTSVQLSFIVGAVGVGFLLGIDESATEEAMAKGRATEEVARIVRLYWVDAATYGASILTLLFILAPRFSPKAETTSPWQDVREGLSYAKQSSLIKGLLFVTFVDNLFIMGPAIIGANLMIKNTMGRGPEDLAWFEACLGGGWLLGTLFILRFAAFWAKGKQVLAGMVLDGLTYIPFFWIRDYSLLLIAIAFHAFWIPFIQINRTSLIQERVPAELHGRIFSLVNLTFVGCTGLSLLLTGWAGEFVEAPTLFLVAGTGGAICGLFGFRFRELRKAA